MFSRLDSPNLKQTTTDASDAHMVAAATTRVPNDSGRCRRDGKNYGELRMDEAEACNAVDHASSRLR